MKKTESNNQKVFTFHQFSKKGYSAFASLSKRIHIGVLSALTLTYACPQTATAMMSVAGVESESADEMDEFDLEEEQTGLCLLAEDVLLCNSVAEAAQRHLCIKQKIRDVDIGNSTLNTQRAEARCGVEVSTLSYLISIFFLNIQND
ncbi:MAG: hypothetical protein J5676_08675 [Bacteroidaceae bacterium]|nr:hypothetical protein [Bacteroidaceae bacterium]